MINQEELRQKYNPDGSDLRNLQLYELEMLKWFDKICADNGIKYWLSYGTLLGAVRHSGFIPWDDDLDVEMLWKDYLKLEKVFKETDEYVLQTHKNDRFYELPWAKMRDKHSQVYHSLYKYEGCFIDIFPLEYTNKHISKFAHLGFSATDALYKLVKRKNTKLNRAIFSIIKGIVFYIFYPLCRFLSKLTIRKELRCSYGSRNIRGIRIENEIFPLSKIKFEGYDFPCPKNCDNYLKIQYKDYMTLPDENQIPRRHSSCIILNNKSNVLQN